MDGMIGAEDEDFESGMDEYNVIPRPQELIQSQLRASAPKAKEKPALKVYAPKKDIRRIAKEKLSKIKDLKKTIAKAKSGLLQQSLSRLSGKSRNTQELEKKFESYLQGAKKSVNKRSSSKTTKDEKVDKQTSAVKDFYIQERELLKRMEEPAFTAQERYDVLNTRDSYIRLKDSKKGESDKKKITGTCPDMCPEKERYSRVAKNCLSLLEMKMGLDPTSTSKDVDYCYMVKEYSRSSADQQEPLPHELRPVPVLMFTMDYLIVNVINKYGDGISIADWYDFIWNRTRSIRKDITQQQLCDVECVDILEKCARFHILCAELLSEEDTATFDPKINNENLTKCLQTLKHMYHDLLSKGIECPNEAEFRAYDILLSLTEGETLRLVKDIRKDVFKSPLVKSAFEAALAFKSNNYIKFFKLMEKATYLSSCIMHRYIHEARVRAMQVIIRAYSVQNNPTILPLKTLVNDLKFENELDASNFCEWHSLDSTETHVTVKRLVFQKPSAVYPVSRVTSLVGRKLKTTLGEIVNNGSLAENPLDWYQPHNSFSKLGIIQEKIQVTSIEDSVEDFAEEAPEVEKYDMDVDMDADILLEPVKSKKDEPILFKARDDKKDMDDEWSNSQVKGEESRKSFPSFFKTQETSNTLFKSASNFTSGVFKPGKISEGQPQSEASPLLGNKHGFTGQFSNKKSSFFSRAEKPPAKTAVTSSTMFPQSVESFFKKLPAETNPPLSPSITNMSAGLPLKFFQWPSAKSEDKETNYLNSSQSLEVPASDILFSKSDDPCDFIEKTETDIQNTPLETDIYEKVTDFDNSSFCDYAEDEEEEEKNIFKEDFVPFSQDVSDRLDDETGSLLALEVEDMETLQRIRDQKMDELILDVIDEVYSQCIKELSGEICHEIVNDEWQKKIEINDNMERIRIDLARKVVYKWKLFCERSKQRKAYKNLEPLSPWIPMLINTEYISSGATSPFAVYKKHCSVSRLADSKIKKLEVKPGWEPLDTTSFDSLGYQPIFPIPYLKSTGIKRFFKLVIVSADDSDTNLPLFNEWICKKLNLSACSKDSGDKERLLNFYTLHGGKTVVCVRSVILGRQSPSSNILNLLDGISAMILCFSTRYPDLKIFHTVLDEFNVLLSNANLLSPFPLFTFLLPSQEKHNVVVPLASFLDDRLYSDKIFSSVELHELSKTCSFISNSEELAGAMKWLVDKQEPLPVVLNCNLQNYLEDSFAAVFNSLFWKLSLQEFKPLLQMPNYIITFYNKMLQCRASLLSSEFLLNVSKCWPPQELLFLRPEFRFIDDVFQRKSREFMETTFLPDFEGDPCCLNDLWRYVRGISSQADANREMLFISVQNLIQNSAHFDWPSVISKCAYHLICNNSLKLKINLAADVYFMKEELDAINFDFYWHSVLLSLREQNFKSKKRKVFEMESEDNTAKKNVVDDFPNCNKSYSPEAELVPTVTDIPNCAGSQVECMLKNLKSAMKKQNEESDTFINRLNKSIHGGHLLSDDNIENQTFLHQESELHDDQLFSTPKVTIKNSNSPSFELQNPGCRTKTSKDPSEWKRLLGINTPTEVCTPSDISEKLSELRYNIQKNNILEDNLSLLLHLS